MTDDELRSTIAQAIAWSFFAMQGGDPTSPGDYVPTPDLGGTLTIRNRSFGSMIAYDVMQVPEIRRALAIMKAVDEEPQLAVPDPVREEKLYLVVEMFNAIFTRLRAITGEPE